MSHILSINEYKKALIEQGITDPKIHISLTRSAYVCAFIRIFSLRSIPLNKRKDIMLTVLSYWNESYPIDGPLVIIEVCGFFDKLNNVLNNIKGHCYSELSGCCCIKDNPAFNDSPTYVSLIDILVEEGLCKCNEMITV